MALFPSDREAPELACEVVQIKLNELELHRPRQWGACWLACYLWNLLDLDSFWSSRLPDSRKKTRWINVLKILVSYRLIAPGSEWRLHRHWYRNSGIADLLGEDPEVIQKDKLYRCLDKLLPHKNDFFSYLTQRWKTLFHVNFDVLLYDLTSTYFECDPPEEGKRRFGYSRDKQQNRSTTSHQNFDNKTFRIIHPFHPYRNVEFEIDSVRRIANGCRIFFFNTKGRRSSVPLNWTDVGPQDPFVALSAGRSLFRVEDLLGLVRLVEEINNARCK
jgi:hypothetical protein